MLINWAVLWWGPLAIALPILIHLLNKQRYRTVEWAAMEFLLKAIRKNARRLQVRDLILMAIRTAAVLLFALALLRPAVCSHQSGGLFGKESITILAVDISGSMGVQHGGETALQETVESIREIAKSLKSSRKVLLTTPSDTDVELSDGTVDDKVFDSHLALLLERQSAGRADFAKLMQLIRRRVKTRFKNHNIDLFIFSDMQKSAWDAENRELVEGMQELSERGRIFLVDVHKEIKKNLSISEFRSVDDTVPLGQSIPFIAVLRNHSPQPVETVAELSVNGLVKYQQMVSVPADGSERLVFTVHGDTPGEKRIELKLGGDNLDVDNRAYRVLVVEDKMQVLIVDANPQDIGQDSIGLFLEKVLTTSDMDLAEASPVESAPQAVTALIKGAKRIGSDDWMSQNLADYQMIVLAGLPRIPDAMGERLKRYVAAGGGLLIFPGENIDTDNYHAVLGAEPPGADETRVLSAAERVDPSDIQLLPAQMKGWWGKIPDPKSREAVEFRTLSTRAVGHSILAPFSDSEEYQQMLANVRMYRGVNLEPVVENHPLVRDVGKFDSGEWFAADRAVGAGHVILFSSACDTHVSNFPWFAAFFIIMDRAATYLTIANHPPRNRMAGEMLLHPVAERDAGAHFQFTDPFGHKSPLTPFRTNRRLAVTPQQAPVYAGFHSVRKGAAIGATTQVEENATTYAVSPVPDEFKIRILSGAALRAQLPGVDFQHIRESRELSEAVLRSVEGVELWWLCLLMVFLLLILESYLVIRWRPDGGASAAGATQSHGAVRMDDKFGAQVGG